MNAIYRTDIWSAVQESSFQTHDGTELFYRRWGGAPAGRALVMLHRGHEHGGRLEHMAPELALDGYAIYALDARGHGRSEGNVPDCIADMARDLNCFTRHLKETEGVTEDGLVVLGHSIGAVVATSWVHDYAPLIRGLILAAPAFDVKLRVPFAETGLRAARAIGTLPMIRSRVTPAELTQDTERQQSYQADPLIDQDIPTDLLLDLRETSNRLIADAQAITVPTQILLPGADHIAHTGAAERFAKGLGTGRQEVHIFDDLRHDVLGEKNRGRVMSAIRSFVDHCFHAPAETPDLTKADTCGYTFDEAEALREPLGLLSARGLYWRTLRACTRMGAVASRGLSIGVETGFDSGTTLDYVYRNQPEGLGPLGRLMDRMYLDAIGWRGIRQRKVHLEEIIAQALTQLREEGQPTHVVDIAAGHGRYVLDALANWTEPDSILLRDYYPLNVNAGQKMIEERGLGHIARFEEGDAFDRGALAALTPRPTLGIVSGLYELFPENAPVQASLAGLADAMPEGGYLVYTGQPWHPQLEQIARTLSSHRGGQDWIMRRRTQQEMDQLVRAAGFEKLEQRIDRWGIFTVSLARRVG